MSDDTATPTPKSGRRAKDDIVDAEIVDEPTTVTPTPEPAARKEVVVDTAPPAQQEVIFIHAPAAPRKKGNRGIGALLAILAGLVFAALLAVATALIGVSGGSKLSFAFLADARFYIPVLFFIIGFVLLVIILNRASWWAYIVGSLLLAIFVYFGSVFLGLLGQGLLSRTPAEAANMYAIALRDPFVIVSAILAREVSIWTGAGIASRGRRLKVRNAEAHSAYQQDLADLKAGHERPVAAATAE
jgi:hypothetical protein